MCVCVCVFMCAYVGGGGVRVCEGASVRVCECVVAFLWLRSERRILYVHSCEDS